MRFYHIVLKCVLLLTVTFMFGQLFAHNTSAVSRFETRCGWFDNPTPSNVWLTDRDGEWIIGIQGGHQAEGEWPVFTARQWVETNGSYGYGCACLQVKVDYKTRQVLEIRNSYAKSLTACRKDRALKEPK